MLKKCRSIMSGISALILLSSAGAASAALVTNGNFEADTPLISNPPNPDVTASQTPTGWMLTQVAGSGGAAPHAFVLGGIGAPASKVVDFNGYDVTPNAILSQTIATSVGTPYTFSFDLGNIGIDSLQAILRAEIVGNGGASLVNQTVNHQGTPLVPFSFNFVADSALTTIRFTDVSTSTNSVDVVLDNVAVTATPEPGSLAIGGAATGLMLLRRRRRQA